MNFSPLQDDSSDRAMENAERLEYNDFTPKFASQEHNTFKFQRYYRAIESEIEKPKGNFQESLSKFSSEEGKWNFSPQLKSETENKPKEISTHLEYKEYKSRFYKIELAGFKGEEKTIQLQERSTHLIYQLIEKKIPITIFDREIKRYERLGQLKHPNVLKLCYYTFQFMEENHGEPYCQISLLFENTETDLYKLYLNQKKNKKHIDNTNMLSIIRQCISAMCYLQKEGVTHGNLSLKDIFVSKQNEIKLLPNFFERVKAPNASLLYKTGISENLYYFSPEVYRQANWRVPYEKKSIDLYKSDMFTLGMHLLEVALLNKPSKCYNLYELDGTRLLELIQSVKSIYPDVISALYSQMLTYDEQLRPDFVELHTNIENMGLPENSISLISKIEQSTSIQKLNNPDYLPQDFVNEIEAKIQQFQKKHAAEIVEKVYTNGNKYVGVMNSDKEPQPHGIGSLWWANGDRYEGFWKNGSYEGEGMYYFGNGMKHYGYFKEGEISGLGVRYYLEKGLYFGEWKNGKNNGKGVYIWPNGEKLLGSFKEDEIQGVGLLSWLSGRKIEGIWNDMGEGIGLAQKPKHENETPSLPSLTTQRSLK